MAAALHPEAQARVQKELDGVVGFDRCASSSLNRLSRADFILSDEHSAVLWRCRLSPTGPCILLGIFPMETRDRWRHST